ncbi:glycoside hydrolase family 16 protein [Parabacteroides sp. OttesenSCG-928-G06]|nr:glycoside hydrolase family 16 protein [Parabacteroides sp. OttesenSCG-928-K15]MDL2282252.1 glycoside hydrolase family 16 protein [Parabacteroides sp. OttesenSCG-928-G06]
MKKQLNMYNILFLSLLLAFGCGNDREKEEPVMPEEEIDMTYVPAGYQLVWQDEFNQTQLETPNLSRWWYETGGHGWGNNELQHYVEGAYEGESCAVVKDGKLQIIARKKGDKVVSIRMNTRESWKYGYFEARLKLPKGKGTWPAFWMMPQHFTAWPADGEIDIMEHVGYRPGYVSSAIHCKAYNHAINTQKSGEQQVTTADAAFHVYALEWTEDYIKGFCDGKMHFQFVNDKTGNKDTWPFYAPFYLKLNLAWGGNWGGAQGVDETALPATYEVDYVRVFQKKQ